MSEPTVIALEGDIILATVAAQRAGLEARIRELQGSCILDFSQVCRVDTSALSLCLSCLRAARARDLSVSFRAFPAELQAIAKLVGFNTPTTAQ